MTAPGLDFDWITDGLAVGGGFDAGFIPLLVAEHGIGAVIDLRAEARDDEALLLDHGIAFLHLPTLDLCAVDLSALHAGVAFAGASHDANRRLFIHCEHGIGRSATMALCVLVDRGDEPMSALALLKAKRAIVAPSPPQYHAWIAWLEARAVKGPDFDAFAEVAYRRPDAPT